MIRNHLALFFAAYLSLPGPAAAQVVANDASDVVQVTVMPGWREADGTHIAALKFDLAPGWKTFWRTPGDAGVPTRMSWAGSKNLGEARILWPTPKVFRQNGLRSIGYRDQVVVPLAFHAATNGPIVIDGHLDFGVCAEICLPVSLDLDLLLPPDQKDNVEEISAAMHARPMTAPEAQVRRIACKVFHNGDRARIEVEIEMPPLDGLSEALVIEAANPALWIGEPMLSRKGDTLRGVAEIAHRDETPFRLDMDQIRMMVLTTQAAVDIQGCR